MFVIVNRRLSIINSFVWLVFGDLNVFFYPIGVPYEQIHHIE